MNIGVIVLIIGFLLILAVGVALGIYFFWRKKEDVPENVSGNFLIMSNGLAISPNFSFFGDPNKVTLLNPVDACEIYTFSFSNKKLSTTRGTEEKGRFLLGYPKSGSNFLEYVDTILNPNYESSFNTDFSFRNSKWCSEDGSLCMQITGSSSNPAVTMESSSNTIWKNVLPSDTSCAKI